MDISVLFSVLKSEQQFFPPSKPGSINSRLVRVQVWTKVQKKQVLYTVQCTLYIMGLANAIFLILEEFRGRTLAENNQSIEAFLAKLSHKVLLII